MQVVQCRDKSILNRFFGKLIITQLKAGESEHVSPESR
jgi:hypothetical protein